MSELALRLIQKAYDEKAKILDLGNCGLRFIPKELFELDWIEELYLCNQYLDWEKRENVQSPNSGEPNILSEIPKDIGRLHKLRKLWFNGDFFKPWKVSKIENLEALIHLEYLNLSYNLIPKFENLDTLYHLVHLDIHYNAISKLENLDTLCNLTHFNVASNGIPKLENLDTLRNLTHFDIRSNEITKLENLDKLQSLQKFNIAYNKITKLENLNGLHNLRAFSISGNQVANLENLDSLQNLHVFAIIDNRIKKLENLDALQNLNVLRIGNNRISKLENLDKLQHLTEFDIYGNRITKLENLDKLQSLKIFKVSINKITKLENLDKLENLTHLIAHYNKITSFNKQLLNLPPNLKVLELFQNPIQDIPRQLFNVYVSIYGANCLPPLQSYFANTEWTNSRRCEMILIGNGGAGKTTLAKRLIHNPSNGIQIHSEDNKKDITTHKWYPNPNESDLEVKIWDYHEQGVFGCFSHHALYLLIYTRENYEKAHRNPHDASIYYSLEKWLELIAKRGRGSRVIFVKNLVNPKENQHISNDILSKLMEKYEAKGDLQFGVPQSINAKNSKEQNRRALINEIVKNAEELLKKILPIPKTWMDIKMDLAQLGVSQISYAEYQRIGVKHGLTEQDLLTTLQYFHNSRDLVYDEDASEKQITLTLKGF